MKKNREINEPVLKKWFCSRRKGRAEFIRPSNRTVFPINFFGNFFFSQPLNFTLTRKENS